MKCPTCQTVNSRDSQFCKKCATALPPDGDVASFTMTLETGRDELRRGMVFAGRYEIIESLGTGGMGRVYRAHDTQLNEEVALKLIKPEIAAEPRAVERFRNELKVARGIRHKNVCAMFDLHEEGGTLFLTMEYVRGEDLKGLIGRTRSLTPGTAVSIARQVAEGLAEAHKLGIIHRDLKPANIMIDRDGQAKIMDFGIARVGRGRGVTGEGAVIGTPEYMSPEQVEGRPADARSDIYSLGAVLFEMVVGCAPFDGETPFAIAHKHRTEPAPVPKELVPQIPEGLSRLILRCLEKDSGRRFQSAEEFLAGLEAIEQALPPIDRVLAKARTRTRGSREITVKLTPRKLAIPAGVLLAAAVLVLVFKVFRTPDKVGGSSSRPSPNPPAVAILAFKNNTGDAKLDYLREGIGDLLIANLAQSGEVPLVLQHQVYGVLKRLGLLERSSYSTEELGEIARRLSASYVILGSFSKSGETFRIEANVLDAATLDSVAPAMADGPNIQDLADGLSRRLRANLAPAAAQARGDPSYALAKQYTSSAEALEQYLQGYRLSLGGEAVRSILYFEKAAALDPDFAMAHLWLGMSHYFFGRMREARSSFQKAFDLRERASERDRLFIEAEYYAYTSERTFGKAIEAYVRLLEINPLDHFVSEELGRVYMLLDEWDRAIEVLEIPRKSGFQSVGTYQQLAQLYLSKGLPGRAAEVLEDYLETFDDSDFLRANLSSVYCIMGDLERAKPAIDIAYHRMPETTRFFMMLYLISARDFKGLDGFLDDWRGSAVDPMGSLGMPAVALTLRGKIRGAVESFRRDLAKWSNELDSFRVAYNQGNLAVFLERAGDLPGALAACDKSRFAAKEAEQILLEIMALYRRGVVQIRMGQTEDARRTGNELRSAIAAAPARKWVAYDEALSAFLALQQRDGPRALDHLRKALALTPRENIWIHRPQPEFLEAQAEAYELTGRWQEARKSYEEILSIKTSLWNGPAYSLSLVRSHYRLGKVLEHLGDRTGAVRRYREFMDFWKDADPGLPEVEDARRRLAGIAGPQN